MARYQGKSGSDARIWRRQVSALANRTSDYVRTVKFPLELHEKLEIDFSKIAELSNVTEGTSHHSLFSILIGTHLSGFRFFSNSRQNLSFRAHGPLDLELKKVWKEQTTLAPNFSLISLIEFLERPRRKQQGALKAFNEENLFKDLANEIGLSAADTNDESSAVNFLRTFSQALAHTYSSWQELNENSKDAFALLEGIAPQFGIEFPEIASRLNTTKLLTPEECSIAFDQSLNTTDLSGLSSVGLHQVVAQKSRMLRQESDNEVKAADLQQAITSQSHNALSWLLGTGFLYWRSTPINKILEDFEIPTERQQSIESLKQMYCSIPNDPVFSAEHYSNFRRSLGGKIDSWIANYWQQLNQIREILNSFEQWELNPALAGDAGDKYFKSINISSKEILDALNQIGVELQETSRAVDVLMGYADRLPTTTDIATLQTFNESVSFVSGNLQAIKNEITQDLDSGQEVTTEQARACNFELPKWLRTLPKLNEISGGVPDIQLELNQLTEQFSATLKLKNYFDESIARNLAAAASSRDPLIVLKQREQDLLSKRPVENLNAEDQSKREILNRLCLLAKSGSQSLKEIVSEELKSIFINPKDLNRFLNEGKGRIYRSPFSRSRHQGLSLNTDKLRSTSPLDLVTHILQRQKEELFEQKSLEHFRDFLRMEDLLSSYQLLACPDSIPTSWIPGEELTKSLRLPKSLQIGLSKDHIEISSVSKIRNLLTSDLSGLITRASRESFFVRTKFVRVDQNALVWVPKEFQPWNPPEHVENSNSSIGLSIRSVREITSNHSDPLNPRISAETILSKSKTKLERGSESCSLLQQLPHDWYLDLEINQTSGELSPVEGFEISKTSIDRKSRSLICPSRLIGPASNKTILDHWIRNKNLMLGEYNLMFEQHFKQTCQVDENLNLVVAATPTNLDATVALTITDKREVSSESHPIGDSVIGTDLGEVGIGYSVFKVEEIQESVSSGNPLQPIASGTIPIRSIRDLIKKVRNFRKNTQTHQKFRQGASTALDQLRKSTVGDVLYVIDSLCEKYRGFPVLESSVANLASGGKQLQLIYDKVIHSYWFSDVDAHKSARKHHWTGGENWVHPTLFETERKVGKSGYFEPMGKTRPLKLYPGSAVHPAGTSQTCSKCERNPYDVLRISSSEFTTSSFNLENGRINLPTGDAFLLRTQTDPKKTNLEKGIEAKNFRRRNERAAFSYLPADTTYDFDGVRSQISHQLRRAPKSLMSKDTTQSWYACIFSDCGNEMHADENAAINIVRKWIAYRGIN